MVGLLGSEKTATPFEGGTEIDQVTGSVVLLSSSSMADIDGASMNSVTNPPKQ